MNEIIALAKELLLVEKEYMPLHKKLGPMEKKVRASSLPVVHVGDDKIVHILQGSDYQKKLEFRTIEATTLAQMVLKDIALGDAFYEIHTRHEELAEKRYTLFVDLVKLLRKVPSEEKWDTPANIGDMREVPLFPKGIVAQYKAITTGYKSKVHKIWCFDGITY